MSYIDLINKLGKEKVSQNESELKRHSQDESPHPAVKPDIVCYPESVEDVQMIVNFARENNIAVTPFGAGSGLEGQAIPIKQGITINFERMNKIINFAPENMSVTVQPGLTRLQLNEHINRHGLDFPIDPGADASIGGMVATNASGTTAVRYGSMRDQVLDLQVVLADGRVIQTGTHAKKSSSGYHLTGLFTGSEGTLGIITEVTLHLHGIPEHVIATRCTFATPEKCAEAAQMILLSDIPVRRMELVDANSVAQVNSYGNYNFPEQHSLFFEFAGSKGAVEEEVATAELLMTDLECQNWDVAEDSLDRSMLWKARHEMSYAFRHAHGVTVTGTDVCVPLSQLPKLVRLTWDLFNETGLQGGVLGHVGDGNFHSLILSAANDEDQYEKAIEMSEKIAETAIKVGGTCTGEHGVGLGKKKFQIKEHGEAVSVMKSFKHLLDPMNILNPDKIFE